MKSWGYGIECPMSEISKGEIPSQSSSLAFPFLVGFLAFTAFPFFIGFPALHWLSRSLSAFPFLLVFSLSSLLIMMNIELPLAKSYLSLVL